MKTRLPDVYDDEGNRVSRTRISAAAASDYLTTYSWDYRNRLTDVNEYDNSSVLTKHVHYTYDVFDHLIGRQLDSTGSGTFDQTARYVYDGTDVVLQFDGTSSLTNRYLSAPGAAGVDVVMAEEAVTSLASPGTVTWPLTDNLGSVRDVVDATGAVIDHLVYNSFGQVAAESAPTVHHLQGYAGGIFDPATGLVNYWHRWFDPAAGRWISEDPIGFGAGDGNTARYVGNGPTNAIDPLGFEPLLPQGTRNERTVPPPVGLFPDGSVRTLDPAISPQVLGLLNGAGNGPVLQPHIPGSYYPTSQTPSTARPWTLKPNLSFGTGIQIYSYQSIDICKNGATQTAREIYNRMKGFTYFGPGNIAGVSTMSPGGFDPQEAQGRTFATFRVRGVLELGPSQAVWGAANTLQSAINTINIPVELFYDDGTMTITAVTLGPHMVVGVRRWTVTEDRCTIKVATEAWEQRNGIANDIAMQAGGKAAMGGIWEQYLKNIAKAATGGNGTCGPVKEYWTSSPARQNPFLPGLPGSGVAGPMVPSGYYGANRAR